MHELILWVQEVAVPKLGWFGMLLVAAADTSFISLPEISDLLVVSGAARHPATAWTFVAASALGSVLGSWMLYEISRRGGEPVAMRYVSPPRLRWAEALIAKYGVFAVAIPALSPPPMPFKVFVVAAGIFKMPRARFMSTVFVARGARYVGWAALGALYGEAAVGWLKDADVWIENHPVLAGAVVLSIAGIGLSVGWLRRDRTNPAAIIKTP